MTTATANTDTPVRADSRHYVWVHNTPCCGRQVFAASRPNALADFSAAERLSDPAKGEVSELMVDKHAGHPAAVWHQATPSGTHAFSKIAL